MIDSLLTETPNPGIQVITFNRPSALNALDLETMRRFAEVVDSLGQDNELRTVILTGAGDRAFCSGGDLNELSAYPSAEDAQRMITLMGDALLALERLPVPVLAAINGYALGGGSEIAMACDLRIVDAKTRMGFVHMNMGLIPGWGAGQRLLRTVGYSQAMDLLLRTEVLHAETLREFGLALKVVPDGTAYEHALTYARELAEKPAEVVRAVKVLLQAGLQHSYDEALQVERELFPLLWEADPHLEAVADFIKRQRQIHKDKQQRRRAREDGQDEA